MSQYKKGQYNPKDYYYLIFKDTGKVYEKFRTTSAADKFLERHFFKDELKRIINPKYVVTKKR